MADQMFDHEKLDVYRLAIEYVGETFRIAESLSGLIGIPAINGCARHNRYH